VLGPASVLSPEWAGILKRVLEATPRLRDRAVSPGSARTFRYLRPDDPLPFEELFVPFVEGAKALLAEQRKSSLPAEVLDTFARELLQELAEIAARVLAVEFRAFLAGRQFSGDAEPTIESAPARNAQYRRFIARTYEQGWGPLFEEYRIMARLLAVAVAQWVGKVGEFEQRLLDDLPDIESVFNRRKPLGMAVAVRTGLSDPHDNGRTVIAVEFSSGFRLIYKPRSLGIEKAYFDFIAWLNHAGGLLPFRVLAILDRGDYGWVEHVEHRTCDSDDEIRRYYRRAGNLLCLVYVLNGTDCHYENLIAEGEHPVLVDLETIFHPRAKIAAEGDDADEIAARLRLSVLSTDLLPDPVKVDGQYFDISALARSEQEEGEAEVVVWTHVNTDVMDYRYERQRSRPAHNLPELNGKVAELNDYARFLLAGFEEAYWFVQERAEALLDANGPLRAMFAHDARFIHRSTALYALVLRRALHPAYLSDGADFNAQLEILESDLRKAGHKPTTGPLLRAEIAALWNLDIPKFTARGDENAVKGRSGDFLVAGCFVDSAWNAAQAKIRGLNEEDLRWQLSLIVGSLDVRIANLGIDQAIPDAGEEHEEVEPLGRDELLEVATGLANEIEAKAFRLHDGGIGWMVLNYSPAAERYSLQPMENDLYNGRAGVGLFFAALEKAIPGSRYRALAHASLAPIQRWIRQAPDEELAAFGFGGYAGLSSIVYALTRAGGLLGESELVADARIAALRIRPEQIEKDQSLDAINGSAGAILCLLACHAATGDPQVLARAIACGHRLVQAREIDRFGFKTWPTLDKCHLTGFSHGAAGIAYALLRLYGRTADADFYEAALEGIRFEGRAFVPEHNNWPDYRRAALKFSHPSFSMAWCHGAPGIGLGRIAALDIVDTPEVRRDIDAALASTGSVNLLPRDHLCCGNAGLMDILGTAGERLPAGEWSRKARQLAARTLKRSGRRGGFNIAFHNGFFNPSLFQGAAGVGYQMLRLAEAAKIPSVLLLN